MKKIGITLLALLLSVNAFAQDVSVDVTSNSLKVERLTGIATFIGDVKALYKNVILTSNRLKIVYDEKSKDKNKIEKIIATGNVVLVQGTDKVTSKYAEYKIGKDLVLFSGDVVLNRNGNILRGDHLVMNTKTKQATMKSKGNNRVNAVYFNN